MNITDATFYQRGNKFIPNNNNKNAEIAGVPTQGNEIDYFIGKIERLFIIDLLGVQGYEELQLALGDLINAEQKWIDLIEGVNYTKDGRVYRFDGLRGHGKESLLAYYVFCRYMENDESYYSTTGVVHSNASNSDSFSPSRKYLDCWYQFLNMYQNKTSTNEPIVFSRNGVIGVDYFGNNNTNSIVTLETFLCDHKDDYEGYEIKRYETKNSWGL